MTAPAIEVRSPGALCTVQDGGRRGWAHLGVPPAGPADWLGHTLANRLVGNPDDAAALEFTAVGPRLRFTDAAVIAVTGAGGTLDGATLPPGGSVAIPPGGRTLAVGRCRPGVRGYLAVAGGFDVAETLGSRSTDTLSGLGPPALRAGDRLAAAPADPPPARRLIDGVLPAPVPALRVVAGPHLDRFADPSQLDRAEFTVAAASDRVGVRLDGPVVGRSSEADIPTCGVVDGALQVPPDGHPILLLAGHGATGGYPVLGVVCRADLPAAGQLAPGAPVRFVTVGRAEALAAYAELRRALGRAVVLDLG